MIKKACPVRNSQKSQEFNITWYKCSPDTYVKTNILTFLCLNLTFIWTLPCKWRTEIIKFKLNCCTCKFVINGQIWYIFLQTNTYDKTSQRSSPYLINENIIKKMFSVAQLLLYTCIFQRKVHVWYMETSFMFVFCTSDE